MIGQPRVTEDGEWESLVQNNDWQPAKPSTDTALWRYRTFNRYLSLIKNDALWFYRADKFSDPYEGSVPQRNVEERDDDDDREISRSDQLSAVYRIWRKMTYLNCWHINQYESAAMWKQYSSEEDGIAIKTSPKRLENALEIDSNNYRIGNIDYINYKRGKIPDDDLVAQFFHKRKSFEHESEYRIIYSDPNEKIPDEDGLSGDQIDGYFSNGVEVPVDLDELIEEVRISPAADLSFKFKIELETRVQGYDFPINQSDMDSDPLF